MENEKGTQEISYEWKNDTYNDSLKFRSQMDNDIKLANIFFIFISLYMIINENNNWFLLPYSFSILSYISNIVSDLIGAHIFENISHCDYSDSIEYIKLKGKMKYIDLANITYYLTFAFSVLSLMILNIINL